MKLLNKLEKKFGKYAKLDVLHYYAVCIGICDHAGKT